MGSIAPPARAHLGAPQPQRQPCSRDAGRGGGNDSPEGAGDWLREHGQPECGRVRLRLRLTWRSLVPGVRYTALAISQQ